MKLTYKGLSKEEEEYRIKDWCTLFRRNLDIFNRDFLLSKIDNISSRCLVLYIDIAPLPIKTFIVYTVVSVLFYIISFDIS